jgi:hypothetical protein
MSFTKLPYRPQTRELMDKFLGYDLRPDAPEGSFVQMRNCSSDLFPKLSPRKPRGIYQTPFGNVAGAVMTANGLYYTEGECLCSLSGERINMGLSIDSSKQLVRMGAYVLIFPDRKYINTVDHNDRGDIEAVFHSDSEAYVYPCRADGEELVDEIVSPDEPQNPKDGAYWINTAEYPNTLHRYSALSGIWVKVQATAVRIVTAGIGELFKEGDGVTISGIGSDLNASDIVTGEKLNEQQMEQLRQLDSANVILARGDGWIAVSGIVDARVALSGIFTVERRLPAMDFVVEHGNRLWGCRYGKDAAGEMVNILYASRLGDFRNWTVYRGIDTDSYYANVGTDGPFTGAISWGYGDRVLFFKENGFHTVTGGGPATFRVGWTPCEGVQLGSGKSLQELDGVIYYKSPAGVCALSGSLPVQIGAALGKTRYTDAVGGICGRKYYLNTAGSTFVWDHDKRMWHREEGERLQLIVSGGEDAYLLTTSGQLKTVLGTAGFEEEQVTGKVKWMAQTGILGAEHPDRKYLTRINVRMKLERGSRLRLLIRYDSTGGWVQVCNVASAALRAYDFPIRIRRCDHYELRFEGEGPGEVRSIVKTYQTGSDRK